MRAFGAIVDNVQRCVQHIWDYNTVQDRKHDGRKFRMLCLIGGLLRGALVIKEDHKLSTAHAIGVPAEPRLERGTRQHTLVRVNGPEPGAMAVRERIAAAGARTAFIGRAALGGMAS